MPSIVIDRSEPALRAIRLVGFSIEREMTA